MRRAMRIGVLALQGAFAEHRDALSSLGVRTEPVRTPSGLQGLDGLILPGGESTAMRRLAGSCGLVEALVRFGAVRPVWGVCAGLILLARRVEGEEPCTRLMDMSVSRNAYGRQRESFVAGVALDGLVGGPFPGVFIRAPRVSGAGPEARVLASLHGSPVALLQGRLLATSFHPELTQDARVHRFFLQLCARGGELA